MNYIKVILGLICFDIVLASCDNTEGPDHGLNISFEINLDDPINLKFSEVFDTCLIIPLQTNKDFIVGDIDQIIYKNNQLIILDRSKSKSIFIFDQDGRFKNKINKVGKGPGQYIFPKKIEYDTAKNVLLVYDSRHSKLILYTLGGKFIQESIMPRDQRIRDMLIYDGRMYISREDPRNGMGLVRLNDDYTGMNKVINTYFGDDLLVENGGVGQYLFSASHGEGFIYKEFLTNKILYFEGDSIRKILDLTFSSGSIPYERKKIHDARKMANIMFDNNYHAVGTGLVDSENFLLFDLYHGRTRKLAIWDKINNQVSYVEPLVNDMDGFLPSMKALPGGYYNETSNYLFFVVPPLFFNENLNVEDSNPYKKVLSGIKVEDFDNPILFIYTLKPRLGKNIE